MLFLLRGVIFDKSKLLELRDLTARQANQFLPAFHRANHVGHVIDVALRLGLSAWFLRLIESMVQVSGDGSVMFNLLPGPWVLQAYLGAAGSSCSLRLNWAVTTCSRSRAWRVVVRQFSFL